MIKRIGQSVRVPMFIYWDKLKKRGRHSDALVSSIDILPTILDLAGLSIPDYLQGSSLNLILSDAAAQIHDCVVSESVGVRGELGTGQEVYFQDIMAKSLELAWTKKPSYVEFNGFLDIIAMYYPPYIINF